MEKLFALHSLHNAKNKTYKAYQETVSQKGRCVTFSYVQNKYKPSRTGRPFNFKLKIN